MQPGLWRLSGKELDDACVDHLRDFFHSPGDVRFRQFAATLHVARLNGVKNVQMLRECIVTALLQVDPSYEVDPGVNAV